MRQCSGLVYLGTQPQHHSAFWTAEITGCQVESRAYEVAMTYIPRFQKVFGSDPSMKAGKYTYVTPVEVLLLQLRSTLRRSKL